MTYQSLWIIYSKKLEVESKSITVTEVEVFGIVQGFHEGETFKVESNKQYDWNWITSLLYWKVNWNE